MALFGPSEVPLKRFLLLSDAARAMRVRRGRLSLSQVARLRALGTEHLFLEVNHRPLQTFC